jgi:hypothetical protein
MSRLQHQVREACELAAIQPGVRFDINPGLWSYAEPIQLTVETVQTPLLHHPTSRWVGGRDQHGRQHDVYVYTRPPLDAAKERHSG